MMNIRSVYIFVFIIMMMAPLRVSQAESTPPENPETTPVVPSEKLLPEREIKYEEELSPEWKQNWDFARELYRDKKYSEALVQYEILFTQKADIEEAHWEYVTILMLLKRWDNAKAELEKLLAADPLSFRYRSSMAKVCMENGEVEKTIELSTQLLQEPLTEPEKKEVLEGMVKAHELQGERKKSLDALTELVAMYPDDQLLLLKLAELHFALGNISGAQALIVGLEDSKANDAEVLSLCAEIEEAQQNHESAATYWQRVVGLQPDNRSAHQRLYEFYLKNNNPAMSFKHLEQLIKILPDNVHYLQQAAELNIQLGRLDHALQYYEFALALDQGNEDIIQGKKTAQRLLARDILALIENDAEKKVWQDLSKITPDSIGVYREAANLLREQQKNTDLIKVLQLLHKQLPEDTQIESELAALQQQQRQQDESSVLQNKDINGVQPENSK